MSYIPFLKLKQNEVNAIKNLHAGLMAEITPLFDIPRINEMDENGFAERVRIGLKALKKWDKTKEFYIDVFDIMPTLKPDNLSIYAYTLESFKDYSIIPVVGLDRDQDHLDSVTAFLSKSPYECNLAVRLLPADFQNFQAVETEIEDMLGELIDQSCSVDLLLDARALNLATVTKIALEAANFANEFAKKYECRRIVITGSSIPASAAAIVGTNQEIMFSRLEKFLWATFKANCKVADISICMGDYGVVSPDYSDSDLIPEMFNNVATPKIIYTCGDQYYAVRGSAFKTHPRKHKQYYDLAAHLAAKPFFRGAGFSAGDLYIAQRGAEVGTTGSSGSWISIVVNAHVTFVGQEIGGL